MKPSTIAKSNTEHAHQAALICWTRLPLTKERLPLAHRIYACPNGGSRSPGEGARFKAEGVRAGVPDLFLPVPYMRWAGLYIEMKKPLEFTSANGGLSDKQFDELIALSEQGYAAVVCYSWQEAAWFIVNYFGHTNFPIDRIWE